MKLSKAVKPISYLKSKTADAIREVNENHDVIVITQNGEAKAVLQDITDYEQTQESLALMKMLSQSITSYQKGNHKSAKQALSSVRRRIRETGY
ncbi:type II toxin-antitoxin system Phd/YefM family antitoxin [Kaarinaea lacus]